MLLLRLTDLRDKRRLFIDWHERVVSVSV